MWDSNIKIYIKSLQSRFNICTTRSDNKNLHILLVVCVYVFCIFSKKLAIFSYISLGNWFSYPSWRVYLLRGTDRIFKNNSDLSWFLKGLKECGTGRYLDFASSIIGVSCQSFNRGDKISGYIQRKVTYQLSYYQLSTGDCLMELVQSF